MAGAAEPDLGSSRAQAKPNPQSPCFHGVATPEPGWSLFLNIQIFPKHAESGFFFLAWFHILLLQAPPMVSCPSTRAAVLLFFVSSAGSELTQSPVGLG